MIGKRLLRSGFWAASLLVLVLTAHAETDAAQTREAGYWTTSGKLILGPDGKPLRITGVSWFGLETSTFAPHGLWVRGYKEMLDQIKGLGFNTVRVPFSNQMFDPESLPSGIDYARNPDLVDLTPLEVLDRIITHAGRIGLKIILDRHRPDAGAQSQLWYTAAYPESRWIDDWKMLAARYKGDSTVVGFDLHNEPRSPACWGCGEPSLDWRLAAQRAGAAILEVNPSLLIIVQGVELHQNEPYWWGGNLRAAKDAPVLLPVNDRLVYSAHDYPASLFPQTWFTAPNYPENLPSLWDTHWGYIARTEVAPVLLGEFGTRLDAQSDVQWFDTIIRYLGDGGFHWVFWSWNPNSQDTGGLLLDDWLTIDERKLTKLKAILPITTEGMPPATQDPKTGPSAPEVPPSEPSSTAPEPTRFCDAKFRIFADWGTGFSGDLQVTNIGAGAIDGWTITWHFDGGSNIRELWNGRFSQEERKATVTDTGWNAGLPEKATAYLGFIADYPGDSHTISAVKLNGFPCIMQR